MEELNKEEIERINNVLSTYKDGFESGAIINGILLNTGEPNKNDDIFEMPRIGWSKFGSGNYTETVTYYGECKIWRKPDDKQSGW